MGCIPESSSDSNNSNVSGLQPSLHHQENERLIKKCLHILFGYIKQSKDLINTNTISDNVSIKKNFQASSKEPHYNNALQNYINGIFFIFK